VDYNFKTGNNNIKLLTEYESVIQKVLLPIESVLQNAKQLQHARLSWHVRCPSGIQFPNPDNNLGSHCISSLYQAVHPHKTTCKMILPYISGHDMKEVLENEWQCTFSERNINY
jgi:serine/threonine protein kinase